MARPQQRQRISLALGLALLLPLGSAQAATSLLNVSYDITRELYKQINPAFITQWKAQKGEDLTINQSHGGSTKQVQSVAAGLDADVVTMNQAPDIDALISERKVSKDWRKEFPYEAAPYTTVTVFIVRKGNPRHIKDWDDLVKPGVRVIIPNPKTSGNGRYTYLSAWTYALKQPGGDEVKAKRFVKALFANVPVLDGGGRGSTTTFAQRGLGDVLVTFENEAGLLDKEFGADKFDTIYPSLSIEAAAPVAIVNRSVDKHGTRAVAKAYLNFLFTPAGQEIIAQNDFRPRDKAVLGKYATRFPHVNTFTVEDALGGWSKVQAQHFADGGVFDQIILR